MTRTSRRHQTLLVSLGLVLTLQPEILSARGNAESSEESKVSTFIVLGSVKDEAGKPIPDSTVTATGISQKDYEVQVLSRIHNYSGAFEMRAFSSQVMAKQHPDWERIRQRLARRNKIASRAWKRPMTGTRSQDPGPSLPSTKTAKSDDAGEFRIEGLVDAPYLFQAEVAGKVTQVQPIWPHGQDKLQQVDFVLEDTVSMNGTITDTGDRPVVGAVLTRTDPQSTPNSVRTDAHGRYVLDGLSKYPEFVTVQARGYLKSTIVFDLLLKPESFPRDLVLEPIPTILGAVFRLGDPAKGVSVLLDDEERSRTDEQGRFRIDGLEHETPCLKARIGPLESKHVCLDLRKPLPFVRLEIIEVGRIEVSVKDRTGRPLKGIWACTIHDLGKGFSKELTDEDGSARFEAVKPGGLRLFFRSKDNHFHDERIRVKAHETARIEYVMRRGHSHEFQLMVEDEKPVPEGAQVILTAENSEALLEFKEPSRSGAIKIDDLSPRQWKYTVVADGYHYESCTFDVPGPRTVVTLHRPRTVSGRITDRERRPVFGVRIRATNYGDEFDMFSKTRGPFLCDPNTSNGWGKSDEDGIYSIKGLRPGVHLFIMHFSDSHTRL